MLNISSYKTIIFDCDGVILNSNKIKTESFYQVAKKFGEREAIELVNYHKSNGGISRYEKFKFFLEILNKNNSNIIPKLDKLINNYGELVFNQLLTCEIATKLFELREETINSKWCVVSGSDQKELRQVFSRRGLNKLFNGGVYGSPSNKIEIIEKLIKNKTIQEPSVFIGDSKYDFDCSVYYGLDFIFVQKWSEISSKEITKTNKIKADIIQELSDLLN